MSKDLVARVSKSWFSNYDEQVALDVRCAACENWTPVAVAWQDLRSGPGALELPAGAMESPFVMTKHLQSACGCGAEILLVLTGGAGGRQGEEQYGVAGLRSGVRQFR